MIIVYKLWFNCEGTITIKHLSFSSPISSPPSLSLLLSLTLLLLLSLPLPSPSLSGVGMYVLNTELFGYLLKPWSYVSMEDASIDYLNWKLKILGNKIVYNCYYITIFFIIFNNYDS